jgi:prevent-host-death family protein
MQTVNIHEAKTHLSRLAERAGAGEEIIIAKAGKPVARLMPCPGTPPFDRLRVAQSIEEGLRGCEKIKSYCERRQFPPGCVTKREKSGYIARYAPEFFTFRALPVGFGDALATNLIFSQPLRFLTTDRLLAAYSDGVECV